MSGFNNWQSSTALLMALSLSAGTAAPIVIQLPAVAQAAQFSDLSSGYWAAPFIQALAGRGIISGFPDGTFRPDAPVTRAQFAAMVNRAFNKAPIRSATSFVDVPTNYWARNAIQDAYTTGFLSGYPGNVFSPEQNIPRAQVLVSLASGLNYTSSNSTANTLQLYNDAVAIPSWAQNSVAAATEQGIVVNYPNVNTLNPNRQATRADVAAFIYQALADAGQVGKITSPYIVGQTTTPQPTQTQTGQIPAGTTIAVRYDKEKIYVSPQEPRPVPVTLLVDQNVTSRNGRVVIPANSEIVGEIRLVNGGAQFFAQQLVLTNGTRLPINGTSQIITTTEEVRRGASTREILTGAVLGAGAAAAVAGVTGDRAIATEEVLGGAGIGTLLGIFLGRERATLIVIRPNTDLDITLNQPLALR